MICQWVHHCAISPYCQVSQNCLYIISPVDDSKKTENTTDSVNPVARTWLWNDLWTPEGSSWATKKSSHSCSWYRMSHVTPAHTRSGLPTKMMLKIWFWKAITRPSDLAQCGNLHFCNSTGRSNNTKSVYARHLRLKSWFFFRWHQDKYGSNKSGVNMAMTTPGTPSPCSEAQRCERDYIGLHVGKKCWRDYIYRWLHECL